MNPFAHAMNRTVASTSHTAFATLLLVLVFALSAIAPASAQVFGTEQRLSSIQGPSYTPRIAAHGGNLHVVWWEDPLGAPTNNLGEIYYRRSTDGGATWIPPIASAPTNLSLAPARPDILPMIAAGKRSDTSGSAVYVFWTNDSNAGDLYFTRSVDGGASFQSPQVLFPKSPAVGFSRPGSALVDSQGRVHVAWYDSRYTAGFGQVLYSLSCDNGANWSAPQLVTRPIASADNEAPRLVEDSGGNLYMVVRSSLDGNPQTGWPPFAQYLVRGKSVACGTGATWQFPAQRISRGLPFDLGNTYGAKVIAGSSGRLHTAWWQESSGNNLTFRSGAPRGNGWGAWTDVSGFGSDHGEWDGAYAEVGGFALAEDQFGALHAVIPQYGSIQGGQFAVGPLKYRKSSDTGATWTTAADLAGAPYAMYVDGVFDNGKLHVVWSDLRDQVVNSEPTSGPEIYYRNVSATSAAVGVLGFSTSSINFGAQQPNTTSTNQVITVTNIGGASATVNGLSVTGPFQSSNNCLTLAPGATCQITVAFAPTAFGAASGTLSVLSTGQGSPQTIALAGMGAIDLIEHYYLSILRRPSDTGGKTFWQGELARMESHAVDANEVYYVLAGFFFNSGEYKAFNRTDTEFVTDLYNTFFMRVPDAGGLAYWVGQIGVGMPRNMILYAFLFSTEFKNFMASAISATPSRAEVYAVVDYYRGLLGRLADDGGFANWLGDFRVAQCTSAGAVNVKVTQISQQFLASTEYAARNAARPPGQRTAEYVSDLYYAFLRRSGDLAGFQHWVGVIDSGQLSRDQVRAQFVSNPEFQARVAAIVAQGCLP